MEIIYRHDILYIILNNIYKMIYYTIIQNHLNECKMNILYLILFKYSIIVNLILLL